jgi:predicted PurR-regulated permease PerM
VARNIVIVILAIAVLVFAVLFILGRVSAGEGASRIAELENTANQYRESYQRLKERYSGFEANYNELRKNNERLTDAIGRLEGGVGNAGDLIRDALKTVERLEAIHNEIGN